MNIVVSMLGTTLDRHGKNKDRWLGWRPSVALGLQEDLQFDRYYLLYPPREAALEQQVVADLAQVSAETEVIPVELPLENPWDFEEVYGKLYDFSQTLNPIPETENWYIHITTGTHVAQICLFLLNESRHLPGRLIQTGPARNGGPKGQYSVIDLDLSRYDLLAKRFEVERRNDLDCLKSGIATKNPRFNSMIETIERVALCSREPLLLTGPTGSGKSRLARRIYDLKKLNRQATGEFVEVNCATLRGDQAMSTLFGHRKGAFTGALNDRSGLLKAADGGILFLDEIGELGLDEQAMLLRAVEEKSFRPIGADKEETSDFQLISGTNRNLDSEVRKGRFRADLLARIQLWSFELPGLAERREDIEPNLDYELKRFTQGNARHVTFNAEARAHFLAYAMAPTTPWNGNFREFGAMVTRMATLAPGGRIDARTVEEEIIRAGHAARQGQSAGEDQLLLAALGPDYRENWDRFELAQLREVLCVCRSADSLAEAGKILFAVSRARKRSSNDSDRLSKYLAHFGLSFHQLHTALDKIG